MYKPVQNCQHCGANLTLDDMRKTNCPYCGTVYPHHSMAAQHAQVVGQVFNQMVAQQYGMPPQPPYGAPGMPPGMPPGPGMPGSPYGDPNLMVQAHMQHAQHMQRGIQRTVMISMIAVFVLVGLGIVLSVLL
jgi:hypothetical protein